jgi:hypothetical protein
MEMTAGTIQLANSRVNVKVCNECAPPSPMHFSRCARSAVQGPLLIADCSSCKVTLNNAVLTAIGGSVHLGRATALSVRNCTLHGIALEATAPEPDVTVSFIASRCENCTINPFVLNNATAIVNSVFEPALGQTLLGSLGSCEELKARGVCDRSTICSDKPTGGRQCSCPFGFKAGTNEDGSACIDLCALAREATVSADSIILNPSSTNLVNESANLSFSNFASAQSHELSLRLVPKNATRDASLAKANELVKTGITSAGLYELQLRSAAENGSITICPLLDTLQVQCTPRLSAADVDGTPCMPVISIVAASIRITSSAGVVVFDGQLRKGSLGAEQPRQYALTPIAAGDKLTVAVTVRDIHGALVTRSTLGLSMALKGKTTNKEAPFEPPTQSRSTFELTVSEMWIPEPGEVESALHAAVAVCTECVLCRVLDALAGTLQRDSAYRPHCAKCSFWSSRQWLTR